MKKLKITTIGGGSGQFVLLSALRDIKNIEIQAVVSMADSGGSTGRLRDELGVLPPGDILKCVLALSADRDNARKILQKRFNLDNRLNGHSVGNMLLTMLSQFAGSFPEGVTALGEVLDTKGKVLPVTTDKATLVAELTDGKLLFGEAAIDVPRGHQRQKIKKAYLVPYHTDKIRVHPPVIQAIKKANYIFIGPGDLYTSIIPNFLVDGVKEALQRSRAKVIYIGNIMTKFGETDHFTAKDFIKHLEKFLGRKINIALINSGRPDKETLERYKKQKAEMVDPIDEKNWSGRQIISENLISEWADVARHDEEKLKKTIEKIIH